MKRVLALALVACLLVLGLAACGNTSKSDLDYVKKNGKIVVGITDFAPMDYEKTEGSGEWIGFDADMAKKFGEYLGVDVEFYVIADWGKKFVELETKQIDVIWNGMTICDDVLLNTNCSDPYVLNAQVVVMKADKIDSYPTAESMKDLSVAVENDSAGEKAAVACGFSNIVELQYQDNALMEVAAGTSDACVIDITMARAMTGEGTNYADLAPGISLTSEEYGVGFRKESDVTDVFNDFLAKLMANGKLQELADIYKLTLVK